MRVADASEGFVGRLEELADLRCALREHGVARLEGGRGNGATRLALAYADLFRETYPGGQIRLYGWGNPREMRLRIAAELGAATIVDVDLEELADQFGPFLVVLQQHIGWASHWRTSSRRVHVVCVGAFEDRDVPEVAIRPLSTAAAERLLARLGVASDAASELIPRLEGHPLALRVAGKALSITSSSSAIAAATADSSPLKIAVALALQRLDARTRTVATVLAFTHGVGVTEEALTQVTRELGIRDARPCVDALERGGLVERTGDEISMHEMIGETIGHEKSVAALVGPSVPWRPAPLGEFSAFLAAWTLEACGDRATAFEVAIASAERARMDDSSFLASAAAGLAHELVPTLESSPGELTLRTSTLLASVADGLADRARLKSWAHTALELTERLHGTSSEQLRHPLWLLERAMRPGGSGLSVPTPARAELLWRRFQLDEKFGSPAPFYPMTTFELFWLAEEGGDAVWVERTAECARRWLASEHRSESAPLSKVRPLGILARCLAKQGELEALEFAHTALTIVERASGQESADAARQLLVRATVLARLGRTADARADVAAARSIAKREGEPTVDEVTAFVSSIGLDEA